MAAAAAGVDRIRALDGLRGIAALSVVLAHSIGAIDRPALQSVALLHSPLSLFANGTGAVHVFFVLSGFCLCGSALRGSDPRDWAQFYVRRVFRVQGPYVVAVLLAFAASAFYPTAASVAGASAFAARHLAASPSLAEVAASLSFPGDAHGLLAVGWTLRVEMIYSILLPAMVWVALRFHWSLLIAASLVLAFVEPAFDFSQRYAFDFSAGIALYLERDRVAALLGRVPLLAGCVALMGWLLLTAPRYWLLEVNAPAQALAIFSLGAVLIVTGAVHAKGLQALLAARPVAAFGRVSYSLYLLHLTVILLGSNLLVTRVVGWRAASFVIGSTLVACALAPLMFRWVELPLIESGNRACRWLARRSGGVVREARPASSADAG